MVIRNDLLVSLEAGLKLIKGTRRYFKLVEWRRVAGTVLVPRTTRNSRL